MMPSRPLRRRWPKASWSAAAWPCCVARRSLKKLELEGDEKHGAEIVANVLHYPLRYIAENAGVDGDVVVNRVRQMKGKNEGYNADKDEYGDLVAAGIIDPAKVVRTALQNAASVAALLAHHRFAHHRNPEGAKSQPAAITTTTAVEWAAWAVWEWAAWEAWAA